MCVRLKRALQAPEADLDTWQAEIAQQFELEIVHHFAAEEKEVFPRAEGFPEMRGLVEELKAEHQALRQFFRRAQQRSLDRLGLQEFESNLTAHIRKEERQLFEELQRRLAPAEMAGIGAALAQALAGASAVCAVPRSKMEPIE